MKRLPHLELSRVRSILLTKRVGISAAVIALTFVAAGWFFRISTPSDVMAFYLIIARSHPVWKEFGLRRFGPGDSVEELLRRHQPDRSDEFGRYGLYIYHRMPVPKGGIPFSGLTVVAKDGRLLSATSWECASQFQFFMVPDSAVEAEYRAHLQRIIEERKKRVKPASEAPN